MSPDVVIVGGGVIGASVAYHLAARGARDVLVVDRGGGSTARATGGFRAQFATEVNVRLSLLSRDELGRFRDETGVDPGYRTCGYLFVASSADELAMLGDAQSVQRAAGLTEARAVTPDDVCRLNPALAADGIAGAVFCPTDGFVVATQIQRGYREAAARLGVRFEQATVVGFRVEGDRIVAVVTDAGPRPCASVVDAAGPWAAEVAAWAGVALPVTPLRRQVATTVPTDVLPADMPMTIFADGFHLRVRDGRVLLLAPSPATPDPFDTSVDPAWVAGVTAVAAARVPRLAGIPIDEARCYAGLYEMSPDKHAILGPAPGVANLLLVNGSSGHGVMHSPALGRLAAEILVDGRARSLDVAALRPTRFAEGRENPARSLL